MEVPPKPRWMEIPPEVMKRLEEECERMEARYQDHADHKEIRAWLAEHPDESLPEEMNRDGYWTLMPRGYFPPLIYAPPLLTDSPEK